jgi:hypothetical protein
MLADSRVPALPPEPNFHALIVKKLRAPLLSCNAPLFELRRRTVDLSITYVIWKSDVAVQHDIQQAPRIFMHELT